MTDLAYAIGAFGALFGFYTVLWWILACVVVAVVADQKGRSAFGYFIMALFLSPFFAVLALIAAPARLPGGAQERATALEPLLKQLEAIRTAIERQSPAPVPVLGASPSPASAGPALVKVPEVGPMAYCPGCGRLRGSATVKCVYCGSTEPVVETQPARPRA
jgi:hypothetical protein